MIRSRALTQRPRRPRPRCVTLALTCCLAACAPPAPDAPTTIRLVDRFAEATVVGSASTAAQGTDTGWRFDSDAGFTANPAVDGAQLRDGRLVGRAAGDFPLVHLQRDGEIEGSDLLHAVEIRARVDGGRNLEVVFSHEETSFAAVEGRGHALPSDHRTPIVAGASMTTYVITPGVPVTEAETRHLFIRPTDLAGAGFEIESVRLIFRAQHLAGIPAGIGWHGLAEIYRETVVTRAPERLTYRLTLPQQPRLDLAVGTLEGMPVTFRAEVGVGEARQTLFERTVTRPDRWQEIEIDLGAWAGQTVDLALSLRADRAGALGLWGSPRILDRRADGAQRPPSVLLIIADTLRADHLGLYGYGRPTAPQLSRFAAGGTAFDHCVAQATWTKASVPSILTGLYPPTHGVLEFHDRLAAAVPTVAEAYRAAGYVTLSMSSIRFTGKFTNLHQGFEVLHESGSLPAETRSKTSRHYVDRLLPWLEAHRDVPFFALLHVADPHAPYRPEAPYDDLFAAPGRAERFAAEVAKVVPLIDNPLLKRFEMPTRDELERAGVEPAGYVAHEHDWYDGSIRAMDAELGRLFERIDELGLAGEIIVAFVADHGTEFLDHGRHWHGHSVYGELARVPLVLRGPGIDAGRLSQQTVQTIDLVPTLLEMSGIAPPAGLQGRSLVPLLTAGAGARRSLPAFTFKAALTGAVGPPPLGTFSRAIVTDDFKLVAHGTPDGTVYELYEPRADPLDLRDMAAEHPDVVARLAADLAAWQRLAEADRIAGDEALESLDAEELERLRSLGYIN